MSVFPDKYLGVILVAGRVKTSTVWPMVEMMQRKLATWKGKLLSFQERLVLIKAVLCSIQVYNMAIYKWPSSVIKACEKIIRNFLWSGDSEIRKYKVMSWRKVCTPYSEGGLGIQRLEVINKAFLMKMMWKIENSQEDWALFFKAKYKDKNNQWSNQWKMSSVWSGLKWAWKSLQEDLIWSVGDRKSISLWFDVWIEEVQSAISELSLPEIGATVVNKLRLKEKKVHWSKHIWNSFLHPSVASNIWKLIQGLYIDDKTMVKNGYDMVSRCCICEDVEDSMNHLLWECKFSLQIWNWLCFIFKFTLPKSFDDVWKCAQSKSPLIQKNKKLFEGAKPDVARFKCKIMDTFYENNIRIKGSKYNREYDNHIIAVFRLGTKFSKLQKVTACQWVSPDNGFTMFCCDGSPFGNPGAATFGVVVRDHLSMVLGAITGGLGTTTNYIAEVYAVIHVVELAGIWELQKIIIKSDSETVFNQFAKNQFHDCAAKRGAKLKAGERQIFIGRPEWLKSIEIPGMTYYRFS
ncbi:uncharacterized protein LOC113279242 [Papaver somniferum]|uniref:uncharacterized protein LOC113279242 n=1 Tax=Papaver somniferum TaxID=3469 RepID=UPI000E704E22|nr:uncharacterized protein LOC113279242 [Papaver somniferum]